MNRRITTLSVVSLLVLCTAISVMAKDLIDVKTANGSFEKGMTGWLCHAFGNYSVEGEIVGATKKAPAPDGKKYLSIAAECNSDKSLAIRATNRIQKMKFRAGQKLIVSTQVKTRALDEFGIALITVVFYGKEGSKPTVKVGRVTKLKDTKWTELKEEFTLDERVTAEPFEVRVILRSVGEIEAGTAAMGYVDDLNVELKKK